MKRYLLTLGAALAGLSANAYAQEANKHSATMVVEARDTAKQTVLQKEEKTGFLSTAPNIEIANYRPEDMRGINIFEAPKVEPAEYTGFKLMWGAAFTQQFQGLDHKNTAAPKMVSGVDANKLIRIGHGPNNAVANLYLNGQLARGIRVAMTTYSSARHHNETWVKDGYLLIDALPLNIKPLNDLMKYVTIRAGHFEINYGDAHFRRTDNGNAIRNPLVGNYIMDAFTTEVGMEVYFRKNELMAMGGITGGESRGMIAKPEQRGVVLLSKLAYDKKFSDDLRFRISGSRYSTNHSTSNTLFSGDRAGSRYYDVLENSTSTEAAQAWSGSMQPGLKNSIRSYVVNPFIQFYGLELFGNWERARGRASTESADREWTQKVGEVVYRTGPDKRLYVAGRYNTVDGQLLGVVPTVTVNRTQVGGGWFMTPNILTKVEYVTQKYNNFPTNDIRNGGQFKGFMVEGVVAF